MNKHQKKSQFAKDFANSHSSMYLNKKNLSYGVSKNGKEDDFPVYVWNNFYSKKKIQKIFNGP